MRESWAFDEVLTLASKDSSIECWCQARSALSRQQQLQDVRLGPGNTYRARRPRAGRVRLCNNVPMSNQTVRFMLWLHLQGMRSRGL